MLRIDGVRQYLRGLSTGGTDWKLFAIQAIGFPVILFALMPDRILYPAFYAEDGVVFFANQFQENSSLIMQPYNGYLHLFPRLIAVLVGLMPLELAPWGYVFGGLLAMWLFLLYVVELRSQSRGMRILLSATVLLSPLATECLLTVVNAQWLLQFCPVLMLLRSHSRWYDLPVFAAIALTGPFVLILLPVLLFVMWQQRWMIREPLMSSGILIIAAGALALQATHIVGRVVVPIPLDQTVPPVFLVIAKIAAALMTLAGLLIALFHAWRRKSHLLFLPITGVLFLLVVAVAARTSFAAYGKGISPRYLLLPFTMIIWYFALNPHRPLSNWLSGRAVAFLLAMYILAMIPVAKRFPNRSWSAMAACLKDPVANLCEMKINPDGWLLQIHKNPNRP
ncbi:MAG: hypothetical protein OHK0011_18500 [Turneriella sp.]